MLNKVKEALRIDGNDHDNELTDLIETAEQLLREVGVLESKIVETDPLVRKAIITYCKSTFGTDPKDFDKFSNSFNSMRVLLGLLTSYTVEDKP